MSAEQKVNLNGRDILLPWRKRLFYRVYTTFLFLITIPFLVSLKTSIELGNWFLLVLHSVGYAVAVLLVTVRKIPYRIASPIGLLNFFIVSVSALVVFGPIGSGRIWLFAFSLLVTLFYGLKGGLFSTSINAAVLIVIGLLMKAGEFGWTSNPGITLRMWVITGVTYVFLNGMVVVSMALLVDALRKRIIQESDLRENISLAKNELSASEEKLRTTLRSIGDGVISTDVNGLVVTMNPVAESLTGWKGEEATGHSMGNVFRIISEETRQPVESPVTNVLENGQIVGLANHTLLIAKDGREIPIADSGAPIISDAGEITGVVLVFSDQTQERNSRKAIQSNLRLLQIAGETSKFGGWDVDLESNISTWSDAVADIHEMPRGYSPPVDEGINFYAPEWRQRIKEVFTACAERGISYDEEMEIITQKGKRLWVRTVGYAVKNEMGSIIKVQGSFQDITEHKKQEESLRHSEERYRLLADNTLDVIWLMSLETRFTYVNSAIETMFGFTPAEWIGTELKEHCEENQFARMKKLIEEEVAKGVRQPGIIFEAEMLRRDGSTVAVEIHGRVIFDDKGVPVSLQGMTRDISERKLAESEQIRIQAQLNQSQKMESIGRLAGGVAHDYNNMLGVIIGNAELALQRISKDDPLHADLMEILDAAGRSADITSQLLAFARWQIINPKEIDLNETVEYMLKMLRRLIGEDIDLSWQPGHGPMPVFIDPSQLDQILTNLLVNARDAIGGVGKVTIETDRVVFNEEYCADHRGFIPGEFITLLVSDDGCGMDSKTQESIFEPFFTTKGVGSGTGLGLSTVYGIVKQNNGFINVYSEPGKGTIFRIYLQLHKGEKGSDIAQAKVETPMGRGQTILIVEDEISIMKMTKKMLEHLGYNVLAASTPGMAEALAEEYTGGINLLLTDVVMPEINGRDLAEKLKSLYPTLSVLFMSGYTADVIAHRGTLESGMNFIQKPFSSQDLAIKVEEALGRD